MYSFSEFEGINDYTVIWICNLNFNAIILLKSFVEIMSISCSQLELTLLLLDTIIAINDLRKCNPIYSIDTVMFADDTKIFCKKRLPYRIGTGQYNGSSYRSHNELVLDHQAILKSKKRSI